MRCFLLLFIVGFLMTLATASDTQCPLGCPKIYSPVCGSDGTTERTFSNSCMLRAYNCEHPDDFGLFMQLATASDTQCPLGCPKIYSPVCASNGTTERTFPNSCRLRVYNCEHPDKCE
ncbi:Enhancer of split M1 protein [Blattella germanica]|nr:Enhancer of split M1 protein [Blattella germanica]